MKIDIKRVDGIHSQISVDGKILPHRKYTLAQDESDVAVLIIEIPISFNTEEGSPLLTLS